MLELKRSAVDIVESLTPANIIKSALKNVAQSPDIRTSVINTAIGIGAGFLGNKLIVGKSSNIFKRIIGSTLQLSFNSPNTYKPFTSSNFLLLVFNLVLQFTCNF